MQWMMMMMDGRRRRRRELRCVLAGLLVALCRAMSWARDGGGSHAVIGILVAPLLSVSASRPPSLPLSCSLPLSNKPTNSTSPPPPTPLSHTALSIGPVSGVTLWSSAERLDDAAGDRSEQRPPRGGQALARSRRRQAGRDQEGYCAGAREERRQGRGAAR
eukprot:1315379-Rhodomonas_salina.1